MSDVVRQLKDLMVVGAPSARLLAAFATLAVYLHPLTEKAPWIKGRPHKTRESCVWMSLIARDALQAWGFAAEVRPVIFYIGARNLDAEEGDPPFLHALTIGNPGDDPSAPGRWVGHTAVLITDGEQTWLFDPTLYQAQRPVWRKLPGMIAVDLAIASADGAPDYEGRKPLAGIVSHDIYDGKQAETGAIWFDDPTNTYGDAPDAKLERRRKIVSKLVRKAPPALQSPS